MMPVASIGWNWLKILCHIDRKGVLRELLLFVFSLFFYYIDIFLMVFISRMVAEDGLDFGSYQNWTTY